MKTTDQRVVKIYFDSGELSSEHEENSKGQKAGVSRHWYKNGQLMSEARFDAGLVNGVLREWAENGQLVMCAEMKDGKPHGHFQSWWNNGASKEDGYYVAGERQIGYRWFREDGSLWSTYSASKSA